MIARVFENSEIAHSSGTIDSDFFSVGDAFASAFSQGEELGASFAVVKDGNLLVDICGGYATRDRQTPWTRESIACIYSSGKAVLALLVAIEVSNGNLDYDTPVATYWPEFASNNKGEITVAQALSHQAGLCALPESTPSEIFLDWDAVCQAIAAMAPLWPPGTANGYHPQTVGFIGGELIRRVSGQSVGERLTALRAELGIEVHCGLTEKAQQPAVFMQKPPRPPDLGDLTELKTLAFLKPSSAPAKVALQDWMAAEIPASNMHANARSLALLLQAFACAGHIGERRVLTETAIRGALRERIRGDDLILPFHLSWSAGLMKNINNHFGPNSSAFGHAGFGGSAVLIDPDRQLTIAYVMNKMSPHLVGDPRCLRLIETVYECL